MIVAALALFALPQAPFAEASPPTARPGLAWHDLDGDGDLDALVLASDGGVRLLAQHGHGVFADETDARGLAGVSGYDRALVGDVNRDGTVELVLAGAGGLRLFARDGGAFTDATVASGLADVGPVSGVAWVDADQDGVLDLHVTTRAGAHRVLAGVGDGSFSELDLGLGSTVVPVVGSTGTTPNGVGPASIESSGSANERGTNDDDRRTPPDRVGSGSTAGAAISGGPDVADVAPGVPVDEATSILLCAPYVEDQATAGCLPASSVPALGSLYPISSDLYVDAGTGNVGVGTTTPGYALEVVGQAISGVGNTASGMESAIGGGSLNVATGERSSIAGGIGNRTGYRASVGGGDNNRATGNISTVSGGKLNDALQTGATVGGGEVNAADATHATIAGGTSNTASGPNTSIGGGTNNVAIGAYGTIPGGRGNVAAGAYALAAGRRAQAVHDGAFVWGGATDADFASTAPEQFLVRAPGGVGIGTGAPETAVHVVGGTDVTTSSGGYVQLGSSNDQNVAIDDNEIMARDNGAAARLNLNADGGDVVLLGNSGGTGSVGIGTNTPSGRLEVVGSVRSTGSPGGSFIAFNPSNAAASAKLDWHNDVARIRVGGSGSGAQNGLDIQTTGDDSLLRVRGDGRIGVGTVNPAAELHVLSGSDATTTGGGLLQLGSGLSVNTVYDQDEIMARFNGIPATLRLNRDGGGVSLFEAGSGTLTVGGELEIAEDEIHHTGSSLEIRSDGDLDVPASSDVTIQAGATMDLSATTSATLSAGTSLDVLGADIDVGSGATSALDLQGGVVTATASAAMTLGAPLIEANVTQMNVNGIFFATACLAFCQPSDARWKHDVEPIRGALDTTLALQGRTYRWNDDAPVDDDDLQYGLIAQQVAEVLPGIVESYPDGEHLTLEYTQVIPLLVEALRELRAEKDAELAAMRSELDELRERMARLEEGVARSSDR